MIVGLNEFSRYILRQTGLGKVDISIVIPVFNRSEKIRFCLDRLLKQDYNLNLVQVIIVDDASTDNTFEVMMEYVPYFPNIVLLERKINSGGASLPRNQGMGFISGKWLFFLDSDDYITEWALSDALILIDQDRTIDMVCMPYFKASNSTRGISPSSFQYKDSVSGLLFRETKLYNSLNAVGKLFRAEKIKNYQIDFPDGIKVREDNWFMMKAYSVAKNIAILGNSKQYYYIEDVDDVSLSQHGTPPRDAVKIYVSLYGFLIENPEINLKDRQDLLSIFLNRYVRFIKKGTYAPLNFLKKLRPELKQMLNNKYLNSESKLFIEDLFMGKYDVD